MQVRFRLDSSSTLSFDLGIPVSLPLAFLESTRQPNFFPPHGPVRYVVRW